MSRWSVDYYLYCSWKTNLYRFITSVLLPFYFILILQCLHQDVPVCRKQILYWPVWWQLHPLLSPKCCRQSLVVDLKYHLFYLVPTLIVFIYLPFQLLSQNYYSHSLPEQLGILSESFNNSTTSHVHRPQKIEDIKCRSVHHLINYVHSLSYRLYET